MQRRERLDSRCGDCLLFGAIQGLDEGLVMVDVEGKVFHLNRQAEMILGVDGPRVVGSPLASVLSHTGLAAFWASAVEATDPTTSELMWPSGRSIRTTALLCRSAAGAPIGRALLLRDVTREKKIHVELSESVARRLIEMEGNHPPGGAVAPLTKRELHVLSLLAGGLSNSEIAKRLRISANTVASHLKHLYPKIKVRRRAQAIAYAMSQGIRAPKL